jgi:hypothetical protein
VDAPPEYILSEYEWQHEDGAITPEQRFQVPFAPDYLHKADISGGLPYGIAGSCTNVSRERPPARAPRYLETVP